MSEELLSVICLLLLIVFAVGAAFHKVNKLERLTKRYEAGEMDVNEYLEKWREIALDS